jgi:hypothetical protein
VKLIDILNDILVFVSVRRAGTGVELDEMAPKTRRIAVRIQVCLLDVSSSGLAFIVRTSVRAYERAACEHAWPRGHSHLPLVPQATHLLASGAREKCGGLRKPVRLGAGVRKRKAEGRFDFEWRLTKIPGRRKGGA